jgi:hypothetical protein
VRDQPFFGPFVCVVFLRIALCALDVAQAQIVDEGVGPGFFKVAADVRQLV